MAAPNSITNRPDVSGIAVTRQVGVIFIPLPRSLWRDAGNCDCPVCHGKRAFWDTLGVPVEPLPNIPDTTWTVHHPALHIPAEYAAARAEFEAREVERER